MEQKSKFEILTSKKGFSFSTDHVLEDQEPLYSDYKVGLTVKTRVNSSNKLGRLYLPTNVHGGACINTLPLRFLVNHDSKCVRSISRELCNQSSFSAMSYLVASSEDKVSVFPQIQMDNEGRNATSTFVKYICKKNGFSYITFSKNIFDSVSDSAQHSIGVTAENKECDSTHLFTSFNSSTGVCENVIVSVMYDFLWFERELTFLNATYTLADVPVTPSSFILNSNGQYKLNARFSSPVKENKDDNDIKFFVSQHFKATFTHQSVANESSFPLFQHRSGNPGYEFGKPVFTLK